eukprot:CAMPEP_0202880424 /NCGR_PEP_ID=MMETSP1391-20130828/35079_1 /ASSEMBLY_ACC=CAM_ASM_000867 /TAXON_ID=1034604 /ORGANISM="Chlamydomonas leiostraca, Strain SAG 11-49" /LENGTH=32 /DNA_ID= /DNA_START= /DNA_END= /DNA_ORIENTATION=
MRVVPHCSPSATAPGVAGPAAAAAPLACCGAG